MNDIPSNGSSCKQKTLNELKVQVAEKQEVENKYKILLTEVERQSKV